MERLRTSTGSRPPPPPPPPLLPPFQPPLPTEPYPEDSAISRRNRKIKKKKNTQAYVPLQPATLEHHLQQQEYPLTPEMSQQVYFAPQWPSREPSFFTYPMVTQPRNMYSGVHTYAVMPEYFSPQSSEQRESADLRDLQGFLEIPHETEPIGLGPWSQHYRPDPTTDKPPKRRLVPSSWESSQSQSQGEESVGSQPRSQKELPISTEVPYFVRLLPPGVNFPVPPPPNFGPSHPAPAPAPAPATVLAPTPTPAPTPAFLSQQHPPTVQLPKEPAPSRLTAATPPVRAHWNPSPSPGPMYVSGKGYHRSLINVASTAAPAAPTNGYKAKISSMIIMPGDLSSSDEEDEGSSTEESDGEARESETGSTQEGSSAPPSIPLPKVETSPAPQKKELTQEQLEKKRRLNELLAKKKQQLAQEVASQGATGSGVAVLPRSQTPELDAPAIVTTTEEEISFASRGGDPATPPSALLAGFGALAENVPVLEVTSDPVPLLPSISDRILPTDTPSPSQGLEAISQPNLQPTVPQSTLQTGSPRKVTTVPKVSPLLAIPSHNRKLVRQAVPTTPESEEARRKALETLVQNQIEQLATKTKDLASQKREMVVLSKAIAERDKSLASLEKNVATWELTLQKMKERLHRDRESRGALVAKRTLSQTKMVSTAKAVTLLDDALEKRARTPGFEELLDKKRKALELAESPSKRLKPSPPAAPSGSLMSQPTDFRSSQQILQPVNEKQARPHTSDPVQWELRDTVEWFVQCGGVMLLETEVSDIQKAVLSKVVASITQSRREDQDFDVGVVARKTAKTTGTSAAAQRDFEYHSELGQYRSFRKLLGSEGSNEKAPVRVDPSKLLCRYELNGVCNDPECPDLHFRQILTPVQDSQLTNVGPGKSAPLVAKPSLQDLLAADDPSHSSAVDVPEGGAEESAGDLEPDDREQLCQLGRRHVFLLQGMTLESPKEGARYYDSLADRDSFEGLVAADPQNTEAWLAYAVHMLPEDHFFSATAIAQEDIPSLDPALNVLSRALTKNQLSERLWILYLELFLLRGSKDDMRGMFEQALTFSPTSPVLWWRFFQFERSFSRREGVITRMLRSFGQVDEIPGEEEEMSHTLLEALVQWTLLKLESGHVSDASIVLRVALLEPEANFSSLLDTRTAISVAGEDFSASKPRIWMPRAETFAGKRLTKADFLCTALLFMHLLARGSLPASLFAGPPYSQHILTTHFLIRWPPLQKLPEATVSELVELFDHLQQDEDNGNHEPRDTLVCLLRNRIHFIEALEGVTPASKLARDLFARHHHLPELLLSPVGTFAQQLNDDRESLMSSESGPQAFTSVLAGLTTMNQSFVEEYDPLLHLDTLPEARANYWFWCSRFLLVAIRDDPKSVTEWEKLLEEGAASSPDAERVWWLTSLRLRKELCLSTDAGDRWGDRKELTRETNSLLTTKILYSVIAGVCGSERAPDPTAESVVSQFLRPVRAMDGHLAWQVVEEYLSTLPSEDLADTLKILLRTLGGHPGVAKLQVFPPSFFFLVSVDLARPLFF